MKELKPTLWRTCRVLASEPRLRLMRVLCANQPGLTVSALAIQTQLGEAATSEQARALNARGLIHSSRKGRYVMYAPEANPNVADAPELLTALERAFAAGVGDRELIHHCTAYTHERRIILVKALHLRAATILELAARTGIPKPSVKRHLEKLERRGVVRREGELRRAGIPEDPFAAALYLAALNQ